jgi:hypothetical protein
VSSLVADSDRLKRCSAWIRAWTPAVLLRWCGRHRILTAVLLIGLVLLLVGAGTASADPTGAATVKDGGDVLISWMGIKDSHGVPVAKYTLTLNKGSVDNPEYGVFAALDSFDYEVFLCLTATGLWLIKFVLKFEWLEVFTAPFRSIGDGVNNAMDRYGLAATALAVLAIIVVCTVLAGRTAKAYSHIAMGLLMVGVGATIFAHPLAELVGPDGMLAKGRDTGMQIAGTVSGGKDIKDPDQLVASLADRFLRSPTQMINFGQVSDSISRKCADAWSNGIKHDHGDSLKDDMYGCDDQGKDGTAMHDKTMANPAGILAALLLSQMLGAFLIAFACYFVWHVVRAAVHAMLFAALAPPALAAGVIPGGPQTFAWKTILDCLMAFAAMIVYTAAFGAYNAILEHVFTVTDNPVKAEFLTALVLAFGFALFGPLRRMFDRSRDTVAAKLGRGGGAAGRSGRGWLSTGADVSRVKDLLSGGGGSGSRGPGRIESESGSSGSSAAAGGAIAGMHVIVGGGSGGSAGGGTGGGASGSGVGVGGGAGGQGSGGAGSQAGTSPSPQPAGEQVVAVGHQRLPYTGRLDQAIRIYQASSGGGGVAGGSRHALSESA